MTLKIYSMQIFNKVVKSRPLKNCAVVVIDNGIRNNVAAIYYQDGEPILINDCRAEPKFFRLAFDEASALQRRRIKAEAVSSLQNYKELTPDEMNSKVNEMMAGSLSAELDNQLMGQ